MKLQSKKIEFSYSKWLFLLKRTHLHTSISHGYIEIHSLTRKTWLALSLRVESSGLSTGVWRVNFESNWLTSSSDCCIKKREEVMKPWLRYWAHRAERNHPANSQQLAAARVPNQQQPEPASGALKSHYSDTVFASINKRPHCFFLIPILQGNFKQWMWNPSHHMYVGK